MEAEGKMSLDRIGELMRAVFEELIARDGGATGRNALAAVPQRVKLTETDKGLNPMQHS